MESNLGRLQIKIHMVGMEYLGLNTSVGSSLSEIGCWKCRLVLIALSMNEEEVEGVYISSTQNLTVTHNLPNSVGPNGQTRSDRFSKPSDR